MRDARMGRPVGRVQAHRSSLAGLALILLLGLALLSMGCAQPDQGYPLTPSQDHVRIPSLAPVVQAVMPAVVHVSAVQRPSRTSVGEEDSAGLRRSKHRSADRGLPPAALDELLRRFFGMPETPIKSTGSGFIIDPDGYIVTEDHVVENAEKVTVTVPRGKTAFGPDHRTRPQDRSGASQNRRGPSIAVCRLGRQRYCTRRRLGGGHRQSFWPRRYR